MNIVTILASGVGSRFGSNVPKQFHKINGKMVIEYVVDAILEAKTAVTLAIIRLSTHLNISIKIMIATRLLFAMRFVR